MWLEGGTLPAAAVSTVRLLEIDAPEAAAPFSTEAANFLKQELPVGAKVYLVADRGDTDRLGRYLRYLWKDNGEFFNEKAVRLGFAKAVLVQPNDRYITQIRAAEAEARTAKRGLWAAAAAPAPATARAPQTQPSPSVRTTAPQQPATQAPPKPQGVYYANCDAARAAGAAPLSRSDPGYRAELDRDDDGIACE